LRSARIYAETGAARKTGIAIANPNDRDATVTFFFTDRDGVDRNNRSVVIPARNQIVGFLDEPPFNGGAFTGTFSFDATMPVATLAWITAVNEGAEVFSTILPVANLNAISAAPVSIPQFVDGGGWTTHLLLVNPTDSALGGSLEFYSSTGQKLKMVVNGQTGNVFSYSIPRRSATVLETAGLLENRQSGWLKVTPAPRSAAPSSLAVFQLKHRSAVVSETGAIGQASGSNFSVYVENFRGSILSGVALVNASAHAVTASFELVTIGGTTTGMTSAVVIPARGQIRTLLSELPGFENVPNPFQGILRIRSTAAAISVVGFRRNPNEQTGFMTTTIPALNNDLPASPEELVIPDIADGGECTTQFVLFSRKGSVTAGRMAFLDDSGRPLPLLLR
jgi:hypothetical protein